MEHTIEAWQGRQFLKDVLFDEGKRRPLQQRRDVPSTTGV
jgi:hypothetical protein